MTTTTITSANPVISHLQYFIGKGGPEPHEYTLIDRLIQQVYDRMLNNDLPESERQAMKALFDEELLNNTQQGRALLKPQGYAGDYLTIDQIYTYKVSEKERCRKWDLYFHHQHAPIAVRNRKDFFKEAITAILKHTASEIQLLDVASGPARDLAELYAGINPRRLQTTCIDVDGDAIEYAKKMTAKYQNRIEFIHKNIFKFEPAKKFDVIWSAGLFDYFDDATFTKILSRFLSWLNDGGEIIIGNFSTNNPSRAYMEVFGEWFLHHRSEECLLQLAKAAGALDARVEKEPVGVNLFLRAKKRQS